LLALILGIKHAYDPDHVVAVSTYIVKSSSLAQTLKMSVSWAVGHMATAGIITFLIFLYKDFFLSSVLGYFESVVGVMLILLGMASIISYRGIELFHDHSHPAKDSGHLHAHTHEEGEVHTHFHKHMFGIGIVHGLASNDELIVLFTASLGVATLFGLISYVAIYSLGVILGMVGFGYAISFPILKNRKERLTKSAMLFFGIVSIIYGGLIIFTGPLA
jgi:ABC-type nickel/cobalt efflux system permease component RcnA